MVRPKKHLGQHFLHDQSVVNKCVDLCRPHSDLLGVEVGPGTGVLTRHVKDVFKSFQVYEIDGESVTFLRTNFPELTVYANDFLKAELPEQPMMVLGNFPYNISSQIVFKILSSVKYVPVWMGMFQLEVAERVCAQHGSKQYGILSVLTQFHYDINLQFKVKPGAFHPPPKVQSAVVYAVRKKEVPSIDGPLFEKIVKAAFGQRRKQLRNSLKKIVGDSEFWEHCGFSNLRPEQMALAQFVELTQMIGERSGNG
jgi:16S rRNA (adenine1518-N6/adenine1519-N6)-dimethyltransferase